MPKKRLSKNPLKKGCQAIISLKKGHFWGQNIVLILYCIERKKPNIVLIAYRMCSAIVLPRLYDQQNICEFLKICEIIWSRCERRQGRAGEALQLATRALSLRFIFILINTIIKHHFHILFQAWLHLCIDGKTTRRGSSGYGKTSWVGYDLRRGGGRDQVHRWYRHCLQ